MSIEFDNGKIYNRGHESDVMIRAFMSGIFSRMTCYACQFKTMERASDFTIGDFWKVEKLHPELNDVLGATLLITHSKKAENLLNEIKGLRFLNTDISESLRLNGFPKKSMMISSAEKDERRNEFFQNLMNMDFNRVTQKYFPLNFKKKD